MKDQCSAEEYFLFKKYMKIRWFKILANVQGIQLIFWWMMLISICMLIKNDLIFISYFCGATWVD